MDTDPIHAIRAMKEFCYKGFYSVTVVESATEETLPEENLNAQTSSPHVTEVYLHDLVLDESTSAVNSAMLFHLDVYELADKIISEELKQLAEINFAATIETSWADDYFAGAIEKAYDIAPPGSHGANLRTPLVSMTVQHLDVLSKREDFVSVTGRVPEFGKDVVLALVNDPSAQTSCVGEKRPFTCVECHFVWTLDDKTAVPTDQRCPNIECQPDRSDPQSRSALEREYHCKTAGCEFAFKTAAWKNKTSFWCPECNVTAAVNIWRPDLGRR